MFWQWWWTYFHAACRTRICLVFQVNNFGSWTKLNIRLHSLVSGNRYFFFLPPHKPPLLLIFLIYCCICNSFVGDSERAYCLRVAYWHSRNHVVSLSCVDLWSLRFCPSNNSHVLKCELTSVDRILTVFQQLHRREQSHQKIEQYNRKRNQKTIRKRNRKSEVISLIR